MGVENHRDVSMSVALRTKEGTGVLTSRCRSPSRCALSSFVASSSVAYIRVWLQAVAVMTMPMRTVQMSVVDPAVPADRGVVDSRVHVRRPERLQLRVDAAS